MLWQFTTPDDLRLIGIAPHGDGFFAYIGVKKGGYLQGRYGNTQQEAVDNAVAAVRKGIDAVRIPSRNKIDLNVSLDDL